MKKVLQRFVDVWKPDFLHKLTTTEKSLKTTIGFWFLMSSIIPLVITFVFTFLVLNIKKELPSIINEFLVEKQIPNDAEIIFENGRLSTQNINEPVVFEFEEKKSLFILDTRTSEYDNPSLLDNYESGIIVLTDKIYSKRENRAGFETIPFREIDKTESLSVSEIKNFINDKSGLFAFVIIIIVFFVWFFYYGVISLLTALWWALILFVLCLIFNNKKQTFGKSYESILNFYFIVFIVEAILDFAGLSFDFSTLIIFSIIFAVNLIWIKNNKSKLNETEDRKEEINKEV